MTTMTHRPTEAVCPPWCEGHTEMFQSWDEVDGTVQRGHDSAPVSVADVEVSVHQTEAQRYGITTMQSAYVEVYVGRRGLLTPTEARLMAQTLTELADRIEATR